MQANEIKFLAFIDKAPQFIIPIYQRTYSWGEDECRQLWEDILRVGAENNGTPHFVGSIMYIEHTISQESSRLPLLVIDGQQRLTTISLIIEALARHIPDGRELVDGFSAKKLREYYLLNRLEEDDRAYKLLLTQTDRKTLLSIVQQKDIPEDHSVRVKENFEFLDEQISDLKDNEQNLRNLCRGLTNLTVLDIALKEGQDNPQRIFESMNSTGRALSQADLIRNFILMDLKPRHQSRLYTDYWRPMEVSFGQEAYKQDFDKFMRYYLTVRTRNFPGVRDVYEVFKKYFHSSDVDGDVDAVIEDIHTFANYYCRIALGGEQDPVLYSAFNDIKTLSSDIIYPLLLELYDDYINKIISRDDMNFSVRLIESYLFRRTICGIPSNTLNRTLPTFGIHLKKERYIESIQAHFLRLDPRRRFPMDTEFIFHFKQCDLYHVGGSKYRKYWLGRLENHGLKEYPPIEKYTVEHIMPQNIEQSPDWQKALGSDWKKVHEEWLHTPGNLTLTGYNHQYSNHSFIQKRDMEGGFGDSPIRLNKDLKKLDAWNAQTIQERADRLAKKATEVWILPSLPDDVLASYQTTDDEDDE